MSKDTKFPRYYEHIFHSHLFIIFCLSFGFSSRVNTNILTRRLCRNRSCDDNELYRSNSFKFERFRRDDTDAATVSVNTLPKQVSEWFSVKLLFVSPINSKVDKS